jgi:integrase
MQNDQADAEPIARKDRRVAMTPKWVETLKPEAATVEWRDAERDGLSLRVTPSGKRAWYARYSFAGRERRLKLGVFPALKLAAARESARKALGRASNGTDSQAERQAERSRRRIGDTVQQAVAAWLADPKLGPAKWKGGDEGGSARCFLPHVRAFEREHGPRRLAELTALECDRFVSAPEAKATRNRRLQALRFLYKWALRKALVESDPTAGLEKEKGEPERTRVLTATELRALVLGFDGTRYARVVRLLALTAMRRDEALGAKWAWFDSGAATLTITNDALKEGSKRREIRRVALSPAAVTLLADQRAALFAEGLRSSEYIFATSTGGRPHRDALKPILYRLRGLRSNGQPASTRRNAKKRAAVIPDDVTIHDVRRTIADTLLSRLGVAPWVVEHVVLGHVRPKLARTYMPNLPLGEAREALTRWSHELDAILTAQPETAASSS